MNQRTKVFSIERVRLLSERYLILNQRMIGRGLAVFLSVLLLAFSLMVFLAPNGYQLSQANLRIVFAIVQFVGFAFTSTMFYELNKTETAPFYLTLPATTMEKLCSAWLISFVGYTAFGFVFLLIFSKVLGHDSAWLWDHSIDQFPYYVNVYSIFLFGSVFFRANNFLNTIVSLLLIGIALAISFYLSAQYLPSVRSILTSESLFFISERSATVFKHILVTVITGLLIWFTYRRLKSRELA